MEHRTADIIQETKKLNIRRKGGGAQLQSGADSPASPPQPPAVAADYETQLKASRNVSLQTCFCVCSIFLRFEFVNKSSRLTLPFLG